MDYAVKLQAQGGVCALCGHSETKRVKGTLASLAVDHDHQTGQVRGLLCGSCNQALGYLEKLGMAWIWRAEQYLMPVGSLRVSLLAALEALEQARTMQRGLLAGELSGGTLNILPSGEDADDKPQRLRTLVRLL